MNYEPQKQRQQHDPSVLFRNVLLIASGGIAVATLLLLIGTWRTGIHFFDDLKSLFNLPQPAPEVDVHSIVIQQVRGSSELTTTVFTMQAIVPTRQDIEVGNFIVGTTKLLYIAYGEVRAGVDLSALAAEDVAVSSDTLRVRIPPPRILDSKIDVNRSKVYDYNRGFLNLGPDVAPKLQTLAEREALQKIVAAACADGVLEKANNRARLVVTQLLKQGGNKVTVETQPPLPDVCK